MDLTLRPTLSPRPTISALEAGDTPRSGFERLPSGRVCGLLTSAQYDRRFRVLHSREGSMVSGFRMEPLLGQTSLSGPATAGQASYYHRAITV